MAIKLKYTLCALLAMLIALSGIAQSPAYPLKGNRLQYGGKSIKTFEGIYYIGPGVLAVRKHGAFTKREKPPKDKTKEMPPEHHNVWRFTDTTGLRLFRQKFTDIQPINYGLVLVKRGKKSGFVSRDGRLVIDAICTDYLNVENGYIRIAVKKKAGIISKEGKLILPPRFDGIELLNNATIIAFQEGTKIGLIDTVGHVIIRPYYDNVEKATILNGFIQVSLNGKAGLLNREGGEIIAPAKYDWINASASSFGLLQVKIKDKTGLMDTTGHEVLAPEYDAAFALSPDLIAVKQNDKWGVIDLNGNQHLPYEYETIATLYADRILVKQNKKWGLVDTTGKEVVPPKYDRVDHNSFDKGKLPVREKHQILLVDLNGRELLGDINTQNTKLDNGAEWERIGTDWKLSGNASDFKFDRLRWYSTAMTIAYQGDKAALIDNNGKEITPFIYDTIRFITPTMACAVKGKKNGLVDKSGKTLLPVAFYLVTPIGNGFCAVCDGNTENITKNGKSRQVTVCKWGIVDSTGKMVVDFKYDDFEEFLKGYAPISLNKKQGIIDSTGRVIVEPKYDKITAFQGKVSFVKDGGLWGVIDRAGNELIKPIFTTDYRLDLKAEYASQKTAYYPKFYKGYALVFNGRRWGLVDSLGKQIVEPKYDEIDLLDERDNGLVALVKLKKKWGAIDAYGTEAIKPQYLSLLQFTEGLARAIKGNKYGYIDAHGVPVIEESFDKAGVFKNGWATVSVQGRYFLVDSIGTPMEIR